MPPETTGCLHRFETCDTDSVSLHGFRLFEEFSGEAIDKTISRSRKAFEKADSATKRHSVERVEADLSNFFHWLVESRGLNRFLARYYAISLKSTLLGLTTGVEVGLFFGIILKSKPKESLK